MATTAHADPDDLKALQRQPAIVAPVITADAHKALTPHVPVDEVTDGPFPSQNVVVRTWMALSNFPGFNGTNQRTGNDVWGYTSPSGRKYALMGLGWGLGVVEVTTPTAPVILTVIPGPTSLWRDVTVIGPYAYLGSEAGQGIQVVDLRQIDSGQVTLVRNFVQGGHTNTHTILSNPESGFLYLCGGNAASRGGMRIAGTSPDPTTPTFVGTGWTTQYVHEAQIVTYPQGTPYAGREIAFLFASGPYQGYTNGLAIVDVTNKTSLQQLAFINYPGIRFCHQGWIDDDFRYLYINDELDSPTSGGVPAFLTRVFDITNLSLPRLVSTIQNNLPAVDHNEYVKGRYLYQSNYTTGLRVWDLADPLRPFEIAFIDTRPENDNATYNGSWGNYPFFEGGPVLISDIERGLFIVDLSILEMSAPAQPTLASPGQATPVGVDVKQVNATVDRVELVVSVNGGAQQVVPMSNTGGIRWTANLPALGCGDRASYFFRGVTNDVPARNFTWPLRAGTGDVLRVAAGTSEQTVFADDFNVDRGWTVQDTAVSAGSWVRAQPILTTNPGSPIGDADGSGFAFVTGNSATTDMNGGPTRLLSPSLDLSGSPEARVSVQRWLFSSVGTTDFLLTEVSNNGGSTWVPVENLGPVSGGWRPLSFRVADFVTPTSQVRVRFSVSDTGNNSTTEAGVDAFRVWSPVCNAGGCYANCDGSTGSPQLTPADFVCFLNRFRAGEAYANCDGSTGVPSLTPADFVCFLNQFRVGC